MPIIRVPTKFGRANLRNGLIKTIVAIEATTVMNAEGVPDFTMLQVETGRGNMATGHIRIDSEAFAKLARQWLELYGEYFPLAGASLCSKCQKPQTMLAMGYCAECDKLIKPAPEVLKFICPGCGCTQLQECVTHARVNWVTQLNREGNTIDVGEPEITDSSNPVFGCPNCSFEIPGGHTAMEAAEWLAEQSYNKEGDRSEISNP